MLKERIEQDLKTAMRAGDATQLSVLRSVKSAIIYAEVAKGVKGVGGGLDDEAVLQVAAKEAKKRQESADAYLRAGEQSRADAELEEKEIIEKYLPKALSEQEIVVLVDQVVAELGPVTSATMGRIIGEVKQRAGATANGAMIANLVKERM